MKHILQFIVFSIVLFLTHQFLVIPYFQLTEAVPVVFQHLLLGGFSLAIYFVTTFMAMHYFNKVGFAVLGFLLLKMIFVGIFVNAYTLEMTSNPLLKYIFVGLYFIYLVFLLIKIVPLINIDPTNKSSENN